ncbi:ABC transporter permease subunit [Streptomyces sp. NPDC046237]|uniref:ABC transporter permease subunit n=1 Tax=Streptomyces sp. NPDC046237 TaxID=3154914 RepID=UPI0033ED83AC
MSTLSLKGPHWVTVRQHRRTLVFAGAGVALALAVIAGLRLWDALTPDRYMEDGYAVPADDNRGFGLLRLAMEYAGNGMVLLPVLVGAFVAGPLIARELESGTYRLALTQSVTPVRWFRAKLLTASAAALAATLALMAVYRIGWGRVSGTWQLHWSDRGPYEATGTVLVAYVLLAVAVGALLGQLIRRTVVAMAATGLVTGLVLAVLGALRWDFLPVRTITGPPVVDGTMLMMPEDGLIMDQGLMDSTGARTPGWFCDPEAVPATQCRVDMTVTAEYLDYHPESHFWPTQLIETGIVVALAALTLLVALRVLRRRHPSSPTPS